MPTNLYADVSPALATELVTTLMESANLRIERIVSHAHASPDGFWYDQKRAEWVVVLRGSARLRFENQPEPVTLKPGDYVNIPNHRKHRVEWTTPDEPTIWLAVHYGTEVESAPGS